MSSPRAITAARLRVTKLPSLVTCLLALIGSLQYGQAAGSAPNEHQDPIAAVAPSSTATPSRFRLGTAAGPFGWATAIADLTEAIRLDPENASYYNGRGIVHGESKKYDQALADFAEAIRIAPEDPVAYHNRGYAVRRRLGSRAPCGAVWTVFPSGDQPPREIAPRRSA